MVSLLSAIVFFVWLGYAALKRPAFFLVGVFLIWQFFLKVIGIVYLDIAGPVYSDEVYTYVGGSGSSAPLLIFFVWIPLAIIYLMFRPRRSRRPPVPEPYSPSSAITFADVVVNLFRIFVVVLYIDMLMQGNIPFFTGLERFQYQGGLFHTIFLKFIFLITFIIGYVFTRGRIITGTWDLRCVTILLSLFIYLFLTGHRFGAFYLMASFVGLAISAIYFSKSQGWVIASLPARMSFTQRIARSKIAWFIIILSSVSLVSIAMVNSLFFVRGYGSSVGEELFQRLFVQPVHFYWLTWCRLQEDNISTAKAFDFMFLNPFDAARNTAVQYLMYLNLGWNLAKTIYVDNNNDYAGGYPEIVFELGGIWGGLLITLLASLVVAYLYRLCILALCRGHFLTSVFSVYVCYGFVGFYLGGMMNFIMTWTYWLKIFLLILAVLIDKSLNFYKKRLFPWVILRRGSSPFLNRIVSVGSEKYF